MAKSKFDNNYKRSFPESKPSSKLLHQPSSLPEEDYWLAPKEARLGNYTSTSLTQAESLLDSIVELEAAQIRNKSWLDSLFTPLGVSAILVVLLTNVIASSVIFLNYKAEFQSNSANSAKDRLVKPEISNSPNLAQQEFVDLNLMTLSTLGSPVDKSKVDRQQHSSSIRLNSKVKRKKVVASAPAIASVNPLNSSSYPVSSTALINTNYYYILTEYNGEQSLVRAKKKVSNASVISFPQGLFIYMGAFYASQDADRFVEQLEQQGIQAYIYHPE
jgi:cell division septation protein DedD